MQLLANTTSPFVRIARICLAEKGISLLPTIVDPWADDERLRSANPATRVPTLVLDDGTPLTESLLIAQWLEATRPSPHWPSLFGSTERMAGVLSRAGLALGAIDASVHTIITRKVTAPVLFDETPVGLRRRRTMIEGMLALDGQVDQMQASPQEPPTLDVICAVVLMDYQQFRYGGQPWLPSVSNLGHLADQMRQRSSFAQTTPR
jgi:glutathione S-transferase